MTKYRIASDLHTEFLHDDEVKDFALAAFPPLPDDHDSTLILAGDIGSMHQPEILKAFLGEVSPRFKQILYIAGNHEYYGGDLQTTPGTILDLISDVPNIKFNFGAHWLENDEKIIGFTLWTDYDGANIHSMNEAHMRMNDYRLITNGNRLARPEDMLEIHRGTVMQLESVIQEGDIVVTHHTPSMRCIPKEYLTDRVNGAYHSDLEGLIFRKRPALWICGHTHTAFDQAIGNTRVVINPRGYGNQYKKNGYNPTLVIEL